MADKNIPFPNEYRNKELGRVVEGIFDPDGMTRTGTGYLYEKDYKATRDALEDVRTKSQFLFNATVDHITGAQPLSGQDKNKVKEILGEKGVSLDGEVTQKIVKDWKANSASLSASYEPSYMVDVGRPVDRRFYEGVAQKVDSARESRPEMAKDIDRLLVSGSGQDVINPARWYKEQNAGLDGVEGLANRFKMSVSGINGTDLPAAREYVRRNPAPSPEKAPEV